MTLTKDAVGLTLVGSRDSRPTQDEWNRHLSSKRKKMRELVAGIKDGSVRDFGDAFDDLLLDAHADAATLGRQRAGNLAYQNTDDILWGIAAKDKDADYLLRFLDDIAGGRYGTMDALNYSAIANRADLYVSRSRGTANQAFVDASTDQDEFIWRLGGNENHCSECPELAAMSPWYKDDLFYVPGDGDTPCLSRCKCYLVRADGITGFKN